MVSASARRKTKAGLGTSLFALLATVALPQSTTPDDTNWIFFAIPGDKQVGVPVAGPVINARVQNPDGSSSGLVRVWSEEQAVAGFLVWEWRNSTDLPIEPDKDTSYRPMGKPAMQVVQKYLLTPSPLTETQPAEQPSATTAPAKPAEPVSLGQ